MATTIRVGQQVLVRVKAFRDIKGNPVSVDESSLVWATDNSDLFTLVPSADGKECMVVVKGMLGEAKVQLTADADPGEAVKLVIGTAEFEVIAGLASTVELEIGTPEEQPTP